MLSCPWRVMVWGGEAACMQVPDTARQQFLATWLPWKIITSVQGHLEHQQQAGETGSFSEQMQDSIAEHLQACAQLSDRLRAVEA